MKPTAKQILILQGHPDATRRHFGHELADAYAQAARAAGHAVETVDVARLEFPLLRSQADWKEGAVPPALAPVQQAILGAGHLLFFFPLWLGDMPALLKGFLEQVARPGFAFSAEGGNPFAHKALKGRSARVVVTMGMPALVYRWYFRAHSVRSLERNVLGFVGIAPVHETLVGLVDALGEEGRRKWVDRLAKLGREAA
jgi:putative NADPH-quinone reductase